MQDWINSKLKNLDNIKNLVLHWEKIYNQRLVTN